MNHSRIRVGIFDLECADLDQVAIGEHLIPHLVAVDARAIARAEISYARSAIDDLDLAVPAADGLIGQYDFIVRRSTDRRDLAILDRDLADPLDFIDSELWQAPGLSVNHWGHYVFPGVPGLAIFNQNKRPGQAGCSVL